MLPERERAGYLSVHKAMGRIEGNVLRSPAELDSTDCDLHRIFRAKTRRLPIGGELDADVRRRDQGQHPDRYVEVPDFLDRSTDFAAESELGHYVSSMIMHKSTILECQ